MRYTRRTNVQREDDRTTRTMRELQKAAECQWAAEQAPSVPESPTVEPLSATEASPSHCQGVLQEGRWREKQRRLAGLFLLLLFGILWIFFVIWGVHYLKIIIIWGVHHLEGNTNDLGGPLFEIIIIIWGVHYLEGNTNDLGGPVFENNNHLRGPLLRIIMIWVVHYLKIIII